ncbi:hypothetical protein BHE74_00032995 [Ensete ventricosum]|nr:hypothetical protein BHE74_00032995 [Ensete ventricosum]
MDFFAGARVIRLRSFNNKYLVAMKDTIRVDMEEFGFSDGARWIVEIIANEQRLRLRSLWNRYLAADYFTVSQQLPDRIGFGNDWEPLANGPHVLLSLNDVRYLRAAERPIPWLVNVTLGTPSWDRSWAPFYWDVEILWEEHSPLLLPYQAAAPRPSSTAAGPSDLSDIPAQFFTSAAEVNCASIMAAIHSSPTNAVAPALPTSSSYSRYQVCWMIIVLFLLILMVLGLQFFPKLMNLFKATLILESSCRPPCFSVLNAQQMDREIKYFVANDEGIWNPAYVRTLMFTETSTSEVIRRLKADMRIEDIYVFTRHRRTGCLMALGGELPHMFEFYNDLVVFIALLPREFLRLLSSASSLLSEELFLDCFLFTDRSVQRSQMATAFHLQSVQTNRYLVAEGDLLHLRIGSSSMGARWTIEVITNARNQQRIRFRSCFGWCLCASMTWYSLQRFASEEDNAISPQMVEVNEAGRDEWLPFPACGNFMFRGTLDDLLAAGYPPGQNPELDGASFLLYNPGGSLLCNMYDLVPFLWCIRACEPTFPATDDPIARQQQNGQS